MKKLFLYILPFCLLVINSCKKNPLPPETPSSSPVFNMSCDVNGTKVTLDAGVDGYYMRASHYQDSSNVYVYKAELKQNNCTTCGYGITVLINDYKTSLPNASMRPDSGLFIGSYEFNDTKLSPLGYTGYFAPVQPSTTYDYSWKYSDGVTDSAKYSSHFFKNGITSSVTLNVYSLGGPVQRLTNSYNIGNPLQAYISTTKFSDKYFGFEAVSTMTNGTSYLWEFGNQNTSVNSTPSYMYSTSGYFTTTLTLRNGANTCVTHYQVPAFPNYVCQANYTSSFTPVANVKKWSAITVLLTDPSGKVYSTQDLDQSAENNFEVVSVEDYKTNELGEATKKLKIRFNCLVKSGSETIKITNGEAFIAVSYQ